MARNTKKAKVAKVDKYSKVEPEISKWTLIGVIGFFVVLTLLVVFSFPSNEEKIYNAYKPYVTSTYFTKDHPFYQLNIKQVRKHIENDEAFILYIGYEQCSACISVIGPMQRYFFEQNVNELVDHVYYLNPYTDITGVEKLMTDYPLINDSTPQILLFINGEIVLTYQPPVAQSPTTAQINTAVKNFFSDSYDMINE